MSAEETWDYIEIHRPHTHSLSTNCWAGNEGMIRFLNKMAKLLDEEEFTTLLSIQVGASDYGEDFWRIEAVVERWGRNSDE